MATEDDDGVMSAWGTEKLETKQAARENDSGNGRPSSGATSYLVVKVVEGKHLYACDVETGTADAMCVVGFGGREQRTRFIRQTCSPVWQESFKFPLDPVMSVNTLAAQTLRLTLKDVDAPESDSAVDSKNGEQYNDEGSGTAQFEDLGLISFTLHALMASPHLRLAPTWYKVQNARSMPSHIKDLGHVRVALYIAGPLAKTTLVKDVDRTKVHRGPRRKGPNKKNSNESTTSYDDILLLNKSSEINLEQPQISRMKKSMPTLMLKILGAKGLLARDTTSGKSDPICFVYCGEHCWKTSTKRRTCNPFWGEGTEFEFPQKSLAEIRKLELNVQVKDFAMSSRTSAASKHGAKLSNLGGIRLPLSDLIEARGMKIAPRWYPLKALEGMKSIGGKLRITVRLVGVLELVLEDQQKAECAAAKQQQELEREENKNKGGLESTMPRRVRPFDLATVQQNTLSDPAALLDIDTTKIPFLSPTRNKYTFTERFALGQMMSGGADADTMLAGAGEAGAVGEGKEQSEEELEQARLESEAKVRAAEEERKRQRAAEDEQQRAVANKKAARSGTRLALSHYRRGRVEDAFRTVVNLPTDGVYGVSRLLHLASPACLSELVGNGTQSDPDPLLSSFLSTISEILLELLMVERFVVSIGESKARDGEDADTSAWERYFEDSDSEDSDVEAEEGNIKVELRPVHDALDICRVVNWIKHVLDLGLVLQASEIAVAKLTHAMAALVKVGSNKLQECEDLRDAPLIYALLSSPSLLRAHSALAQT